MNPVNCVVPIGRVLKKFSFFVKEDVNFSIDVITEQGYCHCHLRHPWASSLMLAQVPRAWGW